MGEMILTGARRVVLSALAASLCLTMAHAGSAAAEVKKSEITAPANPYYVLGGEAPEATPTFLVKGTTSGPGTIELKCYSEEEPEGEPLATLTVPGTSFEVAVETSKLSGLEQPCVLRAVPEGEEEELPPGVTTKFTGPVIAPSTWFLTRAKGSSNQVDYTSTTMSPSARFVLTSAGDCGLSEESVLFFGAELTASEEMFQCNAALSGGNGLLTKGRSAIQVDGRNVYDTFAANALRESLKLAAPPPALTANPALNPATGQMTIHDTEPLVSCSGAKMAFPETAESCEVFESAGVQLERTWQSDSGGRVIYLTDTWRSTDGASHVVDLLYEQEMFATAPGGAYMLPGSGEFVSVSKEQDVAVPPGDGAILYREKAGGEEGALHPVGAILYDAAPSGLAFGRGTTEIPSQFAMPYTRTVPAHGAAVVRMAFVQASDIKEAQSLAGIVLNGYPPSIAIGSPAGGSTVSSPSVVVSGTASDTGALASVSVNGVPAALEAGGAWSATVPLAAGANTITATATDQAGLTESAAIGLTYAPPPPPPPPSLPSKPAVPAPQASRVGSASGASGKVTVTLACNGSPGAVCKVGLGLTTTEHLKGSRITALSARNKVVTVSRASVSIPAGHRLTVTLKLNAAGRALLARFKRLPTTLTATAGPSRLFKQTVTIKPAKKKPHH